MAIRALIAGLVVLLFGGYAQNLNAQPFEPKSFTFKLQSAEDTQENWELLSLGEANTARARVTFLQTTKGKDYLPIILFTVGNYDLFATLELAVFPSERMQGFVTLYEGDEKLAFSTISKSPRFSKPFNVEIDWSKIGIISFKFLDETGNIVEKHDVVFEGAVEEFAITVTNGTVEVAPLVFSKTVYPKDSKQLLSLPR